MLGFRLMAQADDDDQLSELGRAALHRDGLLIAFLAAHPLRRRNLASLRLGHHLSEQGDVFVLKIAAAETKGRIPYERVIAPRLSAAFGRYIHHHRTVLLRAKGRWRREAGDALWISRDGSPCTEQTFANIIRKRTREAGRPDLSPHLFRSCAASSIAVDAPGDVDIIPAVLGHGSPKTAERHYNLAGSLEASRDHGRLIDDLRQRLSQKPRRRPAPSWR